MGKRILIENYVKQCNDQKAIKKAKVRQASQDKKLKAYRCSDGKTTFYCRTDERGAKAVAKYELKLKPYSLHRENGTNRN